MRKLDSWCRFCGAVCTVAALLCFAASESRAEVWRCNGIYTTHPPENSNCSPAGGAQTCGAGGNKIFTPRPLTGTVPVAAHCVSDGGSLSPFVNREHQKKENTHSSSWLNSSAPEPRGKRFASQVNPQQPGASGNLECLVSFFSGSGCNVKSVTGFVEQVFGQMSDQLGGSTQ